MCDLPVTNNPREFKGIYRELIPKLNKAFMKIQFNNNEKSQFYVNVDDKAIPLLTVSFKDLYAFMLRNIKVTNIWVGKWESDTGVQENEWSGIWKNIHSNILNLKIQSLLEDTS